MAIRHHTTIVTVRLAGPHETHVMVDQGTVDVLIPGLRVILRNRTAAEHMYRIWRGADGQARTVFNGQAAAPYKAPARRGTILTHATVSLAGRPEGFQVYGRTPGHSPSGCGELKVQVGPLRIICDDLLAYLAQTAAWTKAASLAGEVWPRRGR